MSKKRGLTEDTSFPTKKIVIIGDAGAGKSTFKEIQQHICGIHLFHTQQMENFMSGMNPLKVGMRLSLTGQNKINN